MNQNSVTVSRMDKDCTLTLRLQKIHFNGEESTPDESQAPSNPEHA